MDYSDFEAKTRNMIIQNTEYLSLANGCWSIIHKEELLDQCKEMLFDDLIQKVIKATRSVLSQKSKSIMKQTPYYFNTTSEYDNSSVLRHSLIKSLCWIKKALPDLPNCNSDKIEAAFSQLVDSLLKDAEWSTLASLRDSFQYLAELAPDVFLNKIEWGVVNKSKDILHLFPQRSGEILADTNYLSELLWSLEVLAWSPDYLVRSVCILGLLENLPYAKTNWANTPINSIVSILLPWHPQTIADFEKRKNALQCLKKDNPEVFWNVLMKLLPNHTRTTMDNPRPRYLSLNIPKEVKATKLDVQGEYSYLLELAIDTVCNEVGKLSDLIDQIEYMNEPTLAYYLECIESNLETISQEERFGLWLNLRERIAMMKPSEEMVVYKQLDRILLLIKELEPEDIRLKYRELYLGRRYLFEKGDYSSVWERLENEKTVAVKEIFLQYGGEETERFGRAVNNVYDIADKLGRSLTEKELSEIIDACHSGALSKQFTAFCTTSFANTNGANKLLETSLCRKEKDFVLEILSMIPFSIGILGVVDQVLTDDSQYWEKALMPYGCRGDRIGELNVIVTNLTACHRYVTAINLVGRSEFESVIDSKSMYNLLMLAGTEKSIGNETIDNYAIQNIIGWFQKQESIDLELRSQVEFVYLPALDEYSKVQPHALNTRLSLDPEYFCSLLELFYKKNSDDQHEVELSKALGERLAELLFQFKVTPGIDWNGDFNETRFKKWMDIVKEWSKDNDRFVVAMHTVGSGLSYAPLDENRLPPMPIIEELNKVENNDLRRGYYLGILNQRGVHYIDPEGKPEFELAEEYKNKADTVETLGYSRYADILRRIASRYNKEAEKNIQLVNKRTEE